MNQEIMTMNGRAVYVETIKSEVPSCFSIKNGFWIVHDSEGHHVYKEVLK